MNTLIITIFLVFLSITRISSQSNDSLLGKWQTTYEENGEKAFVSYEFKNVDGRLKCYTFYIKDDKGEGTKYHSLAMENIVLKEGNGKAKYRYNEEGKKYVFDANLYLKNENTLQISYSYWGYSNTEIWKRLK